MRTFYVNRWHILPNPRRHLGFIGSTLIMLFCAGLTAGAVVWLVTDWRSYILLRSNHEVVEGRLTNKYISESEDTTTYYAVFEYRVDDQRYENRHSIRRRLYDTLENGMPLDIAYATRDPSVSRLAGTISIWTPLGITLWVILIGAAPLAYVYLYVSDKQWRRLIPIRGELRSISGSTVDRDGQPVFYISGEYQFHKPRSDELMIKTFRLPCPRLTADTLPQIGTPVRVRPTDPWELL